MSFHNIRPASSRPPASQPASPHATIPQPTLLAPAFQPSLQSPTPQTSQASTSQPLPQAPASQQSSQTLTYSSRKAATWSGVLTALKIANESLTGVPVPGLKNAIAGFLEVVRGLEVSQSAILDIEREIHTLCPGRKWP